MHRKIIGKIKNLLSKNPVLHISIASVIALACTASIVYLYRHDNIRASTTHEIKLTEDGFSPQTITITKGDTITFTTARDKPFWPASDLHPTHTIYPEFDPRKPIDPDKSWSFRFDRVGEWRFHDHLSPLFRGVITVRDSLVGIRFIEENIRSAKKCTDPILGNKTRCWQDAFSQALDQQGIDAVFQVFSSLYDADADFRQNCHGITHTIGQQAYKKFKNHEYVGSSPKTSYCGYGFYHGFMEALVHNGANFADAREFCVLINKQLAQQTNAWTPCLHGIGHGVIDGSDSTAWGNTEDFIRPGLALCEKLGTDNYEKDVCASGVFNSLANFYGDSKYRLSLDKQDPLAICRKQDQSYFKAACYEEMNTLLMGLANEDFRHAARFIEAMPERAYQARAIDALATYAVHFALVKNKYESAAQTCRALQPQLRAPCIAGLAAGFMEFGVPEKEYIQALAVCDNSSTTSDEKKECFGRVLWLTSLRYPAEKQTTICASVEKAYRQHCPA